MKTIQELKAQADNVASNLEEVHDKLAGDISTVARAALNDSKRRMVEHIEIIESEIKEMEAAE